VAGADIVAPRSLSYVSVVLTHQARDAASTAVEPVYDYNESDAAKLAADQVAAFQEAVTPVDNAFDPGVKAEARKAILQSALALSPDARQTSSRSPPIGGRRSGRRRRASSRRQRARRSATPTSRTPGPGSRARWCSTPARGHCSTT
jgi:hypothetical protein